MKLSEIIAYLQAELNRVGDLEVYAFDEQDMNVEVSPHGYKSTQIIVWDDFTSEIKEGDFYILHI